VVDDLSAPLGQNVPRKRRFRLPFTAPQAIIAACGLFLLTFLGFAIFGRDPMGGEPITVAKYDPAKLPGANHSAIPSAAPAAPAAAPSGQKTVTIIDGSSGERHEMKVGADGAPASADADAPAMMSGINQQLLENSRYGMVPISVGGLKPWRVYASGTDLQRTRAATMPTISIIIGGLGVGAAKTNDAIVKLPGAVTLAFTPYGSDPGKLVERARAHKHEVLLQLPMEPYDYPDNDPGPQTLLTSLSSTQNLDRLQWLMARMQGYVGVASLMGSRFTASDQALSPILREVAKRGLIYLDDGSSSRSVASQIAGASNLSFVKAEIVLDKLPAPAEIDKALARLELAAREHGSAIGFASASPATVARIGDWAKKVTGRGFVLVPISMVTAKPKSS
jgi:polysaccharide deacetylase 2 family uncharacterized protein YibQ